MYSQSPLIRLCAAAYRALLWLYPPRFRREYGEEMRLLYNDLCRDASRKHGTAAVLGLLGGAVFDTIYNSFEEWIMLARWHWGKTLIFGTGLIMLGLSWVILFMVTVMFTDLFLVPWSTTLVEPSHGTLSQIFNDFFDSPIGSVLPSCLTVLTSVVLFLRGLRGGRASILAAWKFAAVNILCAVFGFLSMPVAIEVTQFFWPFPTDRRDIGFHRSIIPLGMFLFTFAILVSFHIRMNRDRSAGFGPSPVY